MFGRKGRGKGGGGRLSMLSSRYTVASKEEEGSVGRAMDTEEHRNQRLRREKGGREKGIGKR
jgi:hypothetical protein